MIELWALLAFAVAGFVWEKVRRWRDLNKHMGGFN